MEKKKIETQYQKKLKLLIKYNEHYFDKSTPIVEDSKYDQLKKEILDLEHKYKFLVKNKSVSNLVGFKPSKNFKKVAHKTPMLSLANAFDQEDLMNFEKRIINYLDENEEFQIEYSAEPKIDGISASLTYKKGS